MKTFIIDNIDIIISLVTMITTWVMGYFAKKNSFFSNNYIPIQNILIMVIVVTIYWIATGDFSLVIASSSPVATIIYDTIHCIKCENCDNGGI